MQNRRRLAIAGACVLAVVLVGGLIGIQQLTGGETEVAADPSALVNVDVAKATLAGIPETKGVLGNPTAPATIRVYGDLRCPVCREWDAAVAPDVIAGVVKNGQAKMDLRLWAILGPNSEVAHRAGYAAMQQNKLWLYATIVYYNQGNEQDNWFDDAFARSVAVAAGLDLQKFDADRKSAAADQMISDGRGRRTGARADGHAVDRRREGVGRADVLQRRADGLRHRDGREDRRGVRGTRVALIVLAALATAIGAYLTYERSRGRLPPCPVGGGGCATVQHSRYAELAGIPVSLLGALGGLALLGSLFLRTTWAPVATLAIAFTGALFSGYLTALEGFVINAWCAWCVTSAVLWTCAAVIAAVRAYGLTEAT